MIKGRKRLFDDRFGETIGSFLDYSQSASITQKNAVILFNEFSTSEEHKMGLQQMYDWAKDEIEVEVAKTVDIYQKSLFIGHVLTETSAALSLLNIDEKGNFTHKNYIGFNSNGKTVNEADFQDYYFWSHHFLSKMITFLNSIMLSVGRINAGNQNNVIPTRQYSYKINALHSKKQLATSLFNKLVKIECLTESSKSDFINAFIGIPPNNKIEWIGDFGDLRSLIYWCIELKFIEKINNQWVRAASIFTENGVVFDRLRIKDAHKTKKDTKIKIIVNSTKPLRP